VDGKVIKVAEVKERKWRLLRVDRCEPSWSWNTMLEPGGKIIDLAPESRSGPGERGFTHSDFANSADDLEFVTGLPRNPESNPRPLGKIHRRSGWRLGENRWLRQGNGNRSVPGQQLGLAVVTLAAHAAFRNDTKNHFIAFKLSDGSQSWYTIAA